MEEPLLERIKRYQSRQMSAEEQLDFENQLKTDPEFAEEVSVWAAVYAGIQEKGDHDLDAQLTVLGKKLLQEESGNAANTSGKTAVRVSLPRWVYAAAAMLLLALIAWPVYQRLNPQEAVFVSAETIFSNHFQQPPASGVRDAGASAWRDAYERKQFEEAIAMLEKSLSDPAYPRRAEANLFLGLSYLGSGDATQAIHAFQQVNSDSFEWADTQWYLALAYLKTGDVPKARPLLQSIAADAVNPRQAEAAQILKQLK